MSKQTEALKLALEALDGLYLPGELERVNKAIPALREALAEQPAQQCKWPTCQSEEYQQALAEQINRELVGEQPRGEATLAQQEPVAWLYFHNRQEPELDVQLEEPECIHSFDTDIVWKKPLYTTPQPPAQQEKNT